MAPFVPALGLLCVGVSGCEGVSAVVAESRGAFTIAVGGDNNGWSVVRDAWCEVRSVEGSRVAVEFEPSMIAGPGAGGVAIVAVGVGAGSEDMVATTRLGCANASETASPSALMDDIGLLTPVDCFPESASVARV